jgi:hypothetical protein
MASAGGVWWLRTRLGDDLVVRAPRIGGAHAGGASDAETPFPTVFLRLELTDWLFDTSRGNRAMLMEMYRELVGHDPFAVRGVTDGDLHRTVLPILLSAFEDGRLLAFRRARRRTLVDLPSVEPEATDEPVKDEAVDWIEIEVLDDQDQPMPGATYVLTLADGSVRRATLDSSGHARLEGIPAGNCTLTFPKLDLSSPS